MPRQYIITTALMGFGHLRAAHNISTLSGAEIVRVDQEPNVNLLDRFVWGLGQKTHTYASRDAESRSKFLYRRFEKIMEIPDSADKSPLGASRFIRTINSLGAGNTFFNRLNGNMPTLLHTFYLPAMLSLYHGYRGKNVLLLCDTDFHRVWVPLDPQRYGLEYCVPTTKSADRLISYGAPRERIHVTGFPLPYANTGGPDLATARADLEIRKSRLRRDSSLPLTIMFPFSGAGAYSNVLAELVKTILDELREGSLRLVVSCGDNEHAFRNAENLFTNYGIDELEYAEILYHHDVFSSFDRFNQALKSTDIMITKPGELVFYAGLGIPMVFLPPIGAHERKNREYLLHNGCAVDMVGMNEFAKWIVSSRKDGSLFELAENGFHNLPQNGSFEIDRLASER